MTTNLEQNDLIVNQDAGLRAVNLAHAPGCFPGADVSAICLGKTGRHPEVDAPLDQAQPEQCADEGLIEKASRIKDDEADTPEWARQFDR